MRTLLLLWLPTMLLLTIGYCRLFAWAGTAGSPGPTAPPQAAVPTQRAEATMSKT